jgi:hypothetical protein
MKEVMPDCTPWPEEQPIHVQIDEVVRELCSGTNAVGLTYFEEEKAALIKKLVDLSVRQAMAEIRADAPLS